MKPILIVALSLLFPFRIQAQTYVYEASNLTVARYSMRDNVTGYSQTNFVSYISYRKHSREWLIGSITAISGGVFAWSGLLIYALGSDQTTGPPNRGMQDAGIGLMIAGGAAAIMGGVIAHKGKMKDRPGYGWQIISSKINEIGIAYSLK